MDENHNEIGAAGASKPIFEESGIWKKHDGYNEVVEASTDQRPQFLSNFEKLKDLQKGLLFTRDIMSSKVQETINSPDRVGSEDDSNCENDEALLYLFVNRMLGPVNEVSGSGIKFQELVKILDKKENDRKLKQLTLMEELDKYKELYNSLLVEYKEFKASIRNSISACKSEMDLTMNSLLVSYKNSRDEMQKEKEDAENSLRLANREVAGLTSQIRALNGEITFLQNQLLQKTNETDEYRKDNMRTKERCEDLNQAHSAIFEQLNDSEQRNELYKKKILEMEEDNNKLVDALSRTYNDHGTEICKLKEEMEIAAIESSKQREALALTITELTETCQQQVEYSKSVVTHSKQREAELESYIKSAIRECVATVEQAERLFQGAQKEKEKLRKDIAELYEKLDINEMEYQKSKSRVNIDGSMRQEAGTGDVLEASSEQNRLEVQTFLEKSYAKGPDLSWKNEGASDTERLMTRIRQLEKLNEEHMQKIQKSSEKYQNLYDKYTKSKEISGKRKKEVLDLRHYIQGVELQYNPDANEEIYRLEQEASESRLRHAQFQALLQSLQTELTEEPTFFGERLLASINAPLP